MQPSRKQICGRLLRAHSAALLLAAAAGAIGWLPHARHGDRSPYLQGDEWKEAAMVEAAGSGNVLFSEIYIWEHREAPWPFPRAPYWIAAIAAASLGGTGRLFEVADVLLTSVIFLQCYALLVGIGARRSIALLATTVFVLHHSDLYSLLEIASRRGVAASLDWYVRPFHLDSIFSDGSYAITRFPFPSASLILLLGFLQCLGTALARRGRVALVAAGLLLSAITYVRFFDWMVAYPALTFAAAALWARHQTDAAKRLGAIVAIALACSLPYLGPALLHSSDPTLTAAMEHAGVERTHRLFPPALRTTYPVGPICLLSLLAACPFIGARTPARLSFTATILAFVPACTYQVVTGWTVIPDHWYRNHILPLTCAAAAVATGWTMFRFLRASWARAGVAALTAGSLLHAALLFGYYRYEGAENLAEMREALQRVENDAVVLTAAPAELKVLAPHAWSFLGSADRTPVPTTELLERYLIGMKIFGRDAEVPALFEPRFHADLWALVGGEEFVHYRETTGLAQGGIESIHLPPEQRDRWMGYYEGIDGTGGRRLDYILTVDDPRPEWGPPVFEGTSVRLYRYR